MGCAANCPETKQTFKNPPSGARFLCLPHTHSPSSPIAAAVNGHQQKHQPNSPSYVRGDGRCVFLSPRCLSCGWNARVCSVNHGTHM
ncbi:unnamed protein product [Sphacelaria rigidula]